MSAVPRVNAKTISFRVSENYIWKRISSRSASMPPERVACWTLRPATQKRCTVSASKSSELNYSSASSALFFYTRAKETVLRRAVQMRPRTSKKKPDNQGEPVPKTPRTGGHCPPPVASARRALPGKKISKSASKNLSELCSSRIRSDFNWTSKTPRAHHFFITGRLLVYCSMMY